MESVESTLGRTNAFCRMCLKINDQKGAIDYLNTPKILLYCFNIDITSSKNSLNEFCTICSTCTAGLCHAYAFKRKIEKSLILFKTHESHTNINTDNNSNEVINTNDEIQLRHVKVEEVNVEINKSKTEDANILPIDGEDVIIKKEIEDGDTSEASEFTYKLDDSTDVSPLDNVECLINNISNDESQEFDNRKSKLSTDTSTHYEAIGEVLVEYKQPQSRKRKFVTLDDRIGVNTHFIDILPTSTLEPATNTRSINRRRCAVCAKAKKRTSTKFFCRQCNVPTCAVPCFEIYHTRANF